MKYLTIPLSFGLFGTLKAELEESFAASNLVFPRNVLAEQLVSNLLFSQNYTQPTVDSVVSHGCWCAKLDSQNAFTEFLGGPDAVDELDEICRNWFKCRNCNDRLPGGTCNVEGSNSRELLLAASYEMQYNSTDLLSTATCTYGADQCSQDSCTIDLYYAKQIVEFVDDNILNPIVVIDNSTCSAPVQNDIQRKCEGTAPYLKPVEDGASAFLAEGWATVTDNSGEVEEDTQAAANGASGTAVFKLFVDAGNWYTARDKCAALGNGASLAAIYSDAEAALVHALGATDRAWLGGNDLNQEGSWRWVMGANYADEPMTYTRWRGGEPNNAGNEDCLEKYTDGAWNDIPCSSTKYAYICQIRF